MTIQFFIVLAILLLVAIYIVRRVRQTFREVRGGCYGCKGCALKNQMMKKRAKNKGETSKNECFKKKD